MTRTFRFPMLAGACLVALAATAPAQSALRYFTAQLDGAQEVPPVTTNATGFGSFVMDTAANTLTYHVEFSGLTSAETAAHIHGPAPVGQNAGILFPLANGSPKTGTIAITDADEATFLGGQTYVNVHSTNFPNGEIRGQLQIAPIASAICLGQGFPASCPCQNSQFGSGAGCSNSAGSGGKLEGDGFGSLTQDTLSLSATGLPPGAAVVLFQGTSAQSPVPMGDGLRCAAGTLLRLKTTVADAAGSVAFPAPGDPALGSIGGLAQPGADRFYQAWYADPAGPCGTGYNVTNGVRATWVP
jgi:hypothetical protein